LFADGGVTLDDAVIELVVALLSRPAASGFALLKPLLHGSLTIFTLVAFSCGMRRPSGVRRGEQKRERAENYREGQAGKSFSHDHVPLDWDATWGCGEAERSYNPHPGEKSTLIPRLAEATRLVAVKFGLPVPGDVDKARASPSTSEAQQALSANSPTGGEAPK
jgi:hypothetical protein